MKKNNEIKYLLLFTIFAVIAVFIGINIYQSNYRKGIREWIADYNGQVSSYNEQIEEKNAVVAKYPYIGVTLKPLSTIAPELADERRIKRIYSRIKIFEADNETIMEENARQIEIGRENMRKFYNTDTEGLENFSTRIEF